MCRGVFLSELTQWLPRGSAYPWDSFFTKLITQTLKEKETRHLWTWGPEYVLFNFTLLPYIFCTREIFVTLRFPSTNITTFERYVSFVLSRNVYVLWECIPVAERDIFKRPNQTTRENCVVARHVKIYHENKQCVSTRGLVNSLEINAVCTDRRRT